MILKTLLILIFGAIMFGLFSKATSLTSATLDNSELKPREIEFSNSKLLFSMPENFSPDFPADDLVTQVDFGSSTLFEKNNKALLLRRWWDFSESTFFSTKEMGTIMLSININKAKSEYKNRFDLLTDILKGLQETQTEFNKTTEPDFQIAHPETYESFFDETYNQQRWIRYNYGTINTTESTMSYVTPLTSQHYIELSFSMMRSSSISIRDFHHKYGQEFIDLIMNSVVIKYQDTSMQKNLGVNASALDIQDLVLEKTN